MKWLYFSEMHIKVFKLWTQVLAKSFPCHYFVVSSHVFASLTVPYTTVLNHLFFFILSCHLSYIAHDLYCHFVHIFWLFSNHLKKRIFENQTAEAILKTGSFICWREILYTLTTFDVAMLLSTGDTDSNYSEDIFSHHCFFVCFQCFFSCKRYDKLYYHLKGLWLSFVLI